MQYEGLEHNLLRRAVSEDERLSLDHRLSALHLLIAQAKGEKNPAMPAPLTVAYTKRAGWYAPGIDLPLAAPPQLEAHMETYTPPLSACSLTEWHGRAVPLLVKRYN